MDINSNVYLNLHGHKIENQMLTKLRHVAAQVNQIVPRGTICVDILVPLFLFDGDRTGVT